MDQTPQESTATKSQLPIGMITVGVIVLAGVGALGYRMMNSSSSSNNSEEMTTELAATSPETTSVAASDTPAAIASYKDGTYEAVGKYTSPAGEEEIDVSLTVKDGVVTGAQVTPKATAPISKKMQEAFEGGYKELVIGKKLSEISLTKVSGSSLTPQGFNAAVELIKAEASSAS